MSKEPMFRDCLQKKKRNHISIERKKKKTEEEGKRKLIFIMVKGEKRTWG